MNIAICDDDISSISIIEEYADKFCMTHKDIHYESFNSGEELISMYENKKRYDVIILDIELNGISGIETANTIRNYDKTAVIFFLTNHSKYAIDCFKPSPKNFWVKPLEYKLFAEDMDEAYNEFNESDSYYVFKTKDGYTRIDMNQILYVSGYGRKLTIHTFDKIYEFNSSMSKIQNDSKFRSFSTPHKSFFVNLKYIKKIATTDITLVNEDMVPMSKHKKNSFKSDFMKYTV